MSLYKIQDIVTGEFSTGGLNPRWRKVGGKIWKSERDIKSHLRLIEQRLGVYDNCEIVEYELTEIKSTDIKEMKWT